MRYWCFIVWLAVECAPLPVWAQQGAGDTTHINVQGGKIYYYERLIGSCRQRNIGTDFIFIQINNAAQARVAEATHEKGDTLWTIITPVDQAKMKARYDTAAPLPQLLRWLMAKGYL